MSVLKKKRVVAVAAHKLVRVSDDPLYTPVQVGATLGDVTFGPKWCRDDTGTNISHKNPTYCELTALYWLWKNTTAEVAGLCHYRRYFVEEKSLPNRAGKKYLSDMGASRLFETSDIVVPRRRSYVVETIRDHYRRAHKPQDLDAACEAVVALTPELERPLEQVLQARSLHLFNMMIMRRALLDEYCSWLFAVLGRVEASADRSGYDAYQSRVFGFLAERLLNVWVLGKSAEARVSYLPVVETEGTPYVRKAVGLLRRKVLSRA